MLATTWVNIFWNHFSFFSSFLLKVSFYPQPITFRFKHRFESLKIENLKYFTLILLDTFVGDVIKFPFYIESSHIHLNPFGTARNCPSWSLKPLTSTFPGLFVMTFKCHWFLHPYRVHYAILCSLSDWILHLMQGAINCSRNLYLKLECVTMACGPKLHTLDCGSVSQAFSGQMRKEQLITFNFTVKQYFALQWGRNQLADDIGRNDIASWSLMSNGFNLLQVIKLGNGSNVVFQSKEWRASTNS